MSMKLLVLVVKNIRRNLLRSVLTGLGTMVLVVVVILVWSILWYLDEQTKEKTTNMKAIVTERWQMPSRMPLSYAPELRAGGGPSAGRHTASGQHDLAVLRRFHRTRPTTPGDRFVHRCHPA